jgi:hypothetical protein
MSSSFINIKALAKRIAEVRTELAHLLHLESFATGSPTKKRGRPAKTHGSQNTQNEKAVSKRGRKNSKRGALGDSILKFLSTKGKEGAHIKDIASHVGTKPANVTAWTYTTGKSKVKRVKPATFAIKE